jgi:hypothetical protein
VGVVPAGELDGKGFPQLLQNLAPGRFVKEQLGHEISSGLPQLSQNRTPGRFSAWQVGQMITSVFRFV